MGLGSGLRARRGGLARHWRGSARAALFRELFRVDRPLGVAYVATWSVVTLLAPASLLAEGQLVGRLPPVLGAGGDSAAVRAALAALLLVAGLRVASHLVGAAASYVSDRMSDRVRLAYSLELLEALAAPSTVAHLEDQAVLDRVEAATGLTRGPPAAAFAYAGQVAAVAAAGLLSLALVARFAWWLAVLFLVEAVASRAWQRQRYERITTAVFDRGSLHRRSGYLRELAVTPAAAKEVRVFGLADWVGGRFHAEWQEAMADVWARIRSGWARSLAHTGARVGLLGLTGWLAVDRTLAGGLSLAGALVVVRAAGNTASLGSANDQSAMFAEAVERIPVHLALVAELRALALPAGRPVDRAAPQAGIAFEGLRFGYPGRDLLFDGLDLRIEAGTSVAVVGLNGAGKTTLVKLLAGLLQPSGGHVLVDGVPLDRLDQAAWQRRVAAIFQDFWHHPLTARENVALGAPELAGDDAALERAAERAGATDIVGSLPHGWDTVLDRQFDGGVDLSGGQWQRLAIARALFAVEGGARVLVLDEPTAALDVRAEADVYDRFLAITRGLTTIVISHRFSTVRRADRIVVVADGRVVEDGTHDELVAAGGRYARLFRLQAEKYADEPEGVGG